MSAHASSSTSTFRELLMNALVFGHRPRHAFELGPATWFAIDVVAREHPEATPEQIVAAYDAFAMEQLDTAVTAGVASIATAPQAGRSGESVA